MKTREVYSFNEMMMKVDKCNVIYTLMEYKSEFINNMHELYTDTQINYATEFINEKINELDKKYQAEFKEKFSDIPF